MPRDAEGFHFHGLAGTELEAAQPAKRSNVLVLNADRFAEGVDFDVAGFAGQLFGGGRGADEMVQRVEHADGDAAGGAEARTFGGNVGEKRNLHRPAHANLAHRFANQFVFDLVHRVHDLFLRPVDVDFVVEPFFDDAVHVLVNRRADDAAAMLLVEIREVRSPAGKGNAQWCLRDDHETFSSNSRGISTRAPLASVSSRMITRSESLISRSKMPCRPRRGPAWISTASPGWKWVG